MQFVVELRTYALSTTGQGDRLSSIEARGVLDRAHSPLFEHELRSYLGDCGLAMPSEHLRFREAVAELIESGRIVLSAQQAQRMPLGSGGTNVGTAPNAQVPAQPTAKTAPSPAKTREVLTIEWVTTDTWCGDRVIIKGTTSNYESDEELEVEVVDKAKGTSPTKFTVKITGDAFIYNWKVMNVLPPTPDTKMIELDAKTGGKTTPKPLKMHFAPDAKRKRWEKDREKFDVECDDYKLTILGGINYVQGWAAEVVLLGDSVHMEEGGIIYGFETDGCRWMKTVGTKKKYWDDRKWKDLPKGFVLQETNYTQVGFTKKGGKFVSQYGGEWPEKFPDWNVIDNAHQETLANWKKNIDDTWTNKMDIKPTACKSDERKCCRYKVKCVSSFTQFAEYAKGIVIVALGNVRSNDHLWSIGETKRAMPAHEFGHHLGNPDEYAGAHVDKTLNTDGAVNGIDEESIMGSKMILVKRRHFRTVCKHFGEMIKAEYGSYPYIYEAVFT